MSFFEVEAPSIQVDANKTLKRLIKWSNGGKDKVMERVHFMILANMNIYCDKNVSREPFLKIRRRQILMLRFCFLGDQPFVFHQNIIKDYCYQVFKWSKPNFPWQGVLVPLVSVLGLCGNLLSILVLTSSKIDMKVIGNRFIQRLIWMKVVTGIFSSMSFRFYVSVKYERFEEGNFEFLASWQ